MEVKTEIALRDPKNALTFVEQKGDLFDYYEDGELYARNVEFDKMLSIYCKRLRQKREAKEVY